MKTKYLILIIVLFLIPLKANGIDDTYNNHKGCTYSDIIELRNSVSLVKMRYDYDDVNLMTITLTNLNSNFYAIDIKNNIYFNYGVNKNNPSIASVSDYFDNQIITIKFIASKSNPCSNEEILTRSIKLPRYNRFYLHEECKGIDPNKFAMCSKWYPTSINETDFLSTLTKYKESLKKEVIIEKENNQKIFSINDILLKYYQYFLFGILILVIIFIIILKIREKKKSVL